MTTGVVQYLPQDMQLPVGEAGSDSILLLEGCATVNDWYQLLGSHFHLTYRAANGNIVICDGREVIDAVDVHSLQSHNTPILQWYQHFVWNITHEEDINRKNDTRFCPQDVCEIVAASYYDKKAGKPRNGLFSLINKGILLESFGKELFVGGVTQTAKIQHANRESIFEDITCINIRAKSDFGRVAYEILHCHTKMVASLKGYI